MARGLLARLSDGGDAGPAGDRERAIIEHLRVLLNTRHGSVPAAPDYGLIDLVDMVHAFPEALPTLKKRLRDAIMQSEPRLRNVTIRHVRGRDPLVFQFEINARVVGNPRAPRLRLRTQVSTRGVEIE